MYIGSQLGNNINKEENTKAVEFSLNDNYIDLNILGLL